MAVKHSLLIAGACSLGLVGAMQPAHATSNEVDSLQEDDRPAPRLTSDVSKLRSECGEELATSGAAHWTPSRSVTCELSGPLTQVKSESSYYTLLKSRKGERAIEIFMFVPSGTMEESSEYGDLGMSVTKKEGARTRKFELEPVGTYGSEHILAATIHSDFLPESDRDERVVSPAEIVIATPGGEQEFPVRYDSTFDPNVLDETHGAVITTFDPVLRYQLTDPDVGEVAQHISDALHDPYLTFPSWIGKRVPGAEKPDDGLPPTPLHRLTDTTQRNANRDAAKGVCRSVWGDDYVAEGLECDEYPFASTYEGAAKGDDKFSARPVDGGDNQEAGVQLLDFYNDNRLLDGDAFYVDVYEW